MEGALDAHDIWEAVDCGAAGCGGVQGWTSGRAGCCACSCGGPAGLWAGTRSGRGGATAVDGGGLPGRSWGGLIALVASSCARGPAGYHAAQGCPCKLGACHQPHMAVTGRASGACRCLYPQEAGLARLQRERRLRQLSLCSSAPGVAPASRGQGPPRPPSSCVSWSGCKSWLAFSLPVQVAGHLRQSPRERRGGEWLRTALKTQPKASAASNWVLQSRTLACGQTPDLLRRESVLMYVCGANELRGRPIGAGKWPSHVLRIIPVSHTFVSAISTRSVGLPLTWVQAEAPML